MSLRDTITSQQLLAVSLAVIMLVSMSGMAFIGGAGAQTGGTFDDRIPAQEVVNDDLNIDDDDGDVVLLGPENSTEDDEVDPAVVSVNEDGSINVTDNSQNLTGVGLTPERVAALDDDLEFTVGDEADFLDDAVVGNLSVDSNTGNANATIFADFDPQSDFSQINVTESQVNGTHDFIVIGQNESVDAQFGTDSTDGGVVAASVDNSGSDDAQLLVEGAESFEAAVDQLVDDDGNEQPVENEFLENVLFTAVTDDEADTIAGVTLGEESTFATGQTLHSEKITLDDGDERFFSSVSEAVNASDGDNTITVDHGEYDALEGQNVTVDTTDTIQTTDRVNSGDTIDRVDTDNSSIDDPDNEAVINTSVELEAGATLDNVVVQNGTEAAVNITDGDAELTDVVVNYTASTDAVNATAAGATITNSTVMANQATVFEDGEVGLELNENDGANVTENFFVGFETQVANVSDETNATALFNAHEDQFEDDRAQSAVPFSGDDVTSTSLFGAINASDSAASDEDTIEVSAGIYDEDGTVDVTTDNISVDGAGDTTEIENDVDLDSSIATTLTNVAVNGSVTAVANDNEDADVTVDTVTLTSSNVTVEEAADVTVQSVTFDDAGTDAVNISTSEGTDVLVDDVEVNNLTAGTGINVAGVGGENVTVTNNELNGNVEDTSAVDGINVTVVDTAAGADAVINNNDVTDIGNGTAVAIAEANGGDDGSVEINENRLTSGPDGQTFTGIEYNMSETVGPDLVGNEIIGADVGGGEDSVGVDFVNATTQAGSGLVFLSPGTALTFEDNVVTDHARLLNFDDGDESAIDYDAITGPVDVLDEDGDVDEEVRLNNSFGTLVAGPGAADETVVLDESETVVEGPTYAETFAEPDEIDLDGATSYLPGSVSEAVELVNASDRDASELEAKNPSTLDAGNDAYRNDETVTAPAIDSLSITGVDQPLVETNFVIDAAPADGANNVDLSDLEIDAGDETAINVTSNNTQSEFDNLDVTTYGDGLNVTSEQGDVNVINVTNSDFTINGPSSTAIDFAATGEDDRDGFLIDNVDITGPGVDSTSTGLNLSNVDKPGKEGIQELEVTGLTVDGFEVQVALSTNLTAEGITAEDVLDDQVDADPIVFDNNKFEQAVLVLNETGSIEEGDTETLYGSIDTADANADAAGDNATLDVRAGVYEENVTLGEGEIDEVVVEGPQAGVEADAALRGEDEEAQIRGTVDLASNDGDIVVDGVTIIAEDSEDQVVHLNDDSVGSFDLNNTAVSAFGNETTGLPEQEINALNVSAEVNVTLFQTFVGDHDAAQTTNSSVIANSTGTLDIESSTLAGNVSTADGVGVNLTNASDVNITSSAIDTHAEDGVLINGTDSNVTLTSADVTANEGDGINATNATGGLTLTLEEGTTVSESGATGVTVEDDDITLVITDSAVSESADEAVLIDAGADIELNGSTFTNSNVGLNVTNASSIDDDGIINNAFDDNRDSEIVLNASGGDDLNVTLNFLGDRTGPFGPDSAGIEVLNGEVDENVTYDPFLTSSEPVEGDVTTTTAFGHDVVIMPGDGFTTVGVPAEHEADNLGELFGGDADGFGIGGESEVYAFDADAGEFSGADPGDDVGAFDAYVVDYDGEEPISFLVEYESNPQSAPVTTQLQEGLNFVAPPAAANSSIFNQDVDNGDTVQERFGLGSNLYGTGTPSDADFVTPAERFTDGEGTQEVHPHAGYFVTIQEDSQEPIVSDRIFPGVTVDQIEGDTEDEETLV